MMTLTGICENKNYAKFRQKMAGQDSTTLPKITNSFIYAMHDRMLYQIRISEKQN